VFNVLAVAPGHRDYATAVAVMVEDVGDDIRCSVPSGKSLVTAGRPGVTNTSQFSGISPAATSSMRPSTSNASSLRLTSLDKFGLIRHRQLAHSLARRGVDRVGQRRSER
jgi:hypothetical protein